MPYFNVNFVKHYIPK